MSTRAGRYVHQPTGYRAFVPVPLRPSPPIEFDGPLVAELAAAADALGRLDGVTQTLPNADLFVAMYVRQEAVLSSQIEGTQSTLDDVLAFELDPARQDLPADVTEVVNYVRAMNHGLQRLESLPLSLRLLREIHAELLSSGRGAWKDPGEFRRTQNWIGPEGATLPDATFIPPAPDDMQTALSDLERFMQSGLAHAQFETQPRVPLHRLPGAVHRDGGGRGDGASGIDRERSPRCRRHRPVTPSPRPGGRSVQDRADGGGSVVVLRRQHVRVGVHGHRDRRVSEPFGDDLDRHLLGEKKRGVGVPQTVQRDTG